MADIRCYGITQDEEDADGSLRCRQIAKVVTDFGINEKQRLKLIYLLALELEDRDHLQEVTALIKRLEAGGKRSTLITEV